MKVLVTGASGFLGGHMCEGLVKDHQVIGMVRKGSDSTLLRELGVELRTADLTDPTSLDAAVNGVDAVIHLAAYYSFTGEWKDYEQVNVQGTKALLASMLHHGVRRMLYCSSTEAMGPTGPHPADEDQEPHPVYNYGRSKLMGEQVVKDHASKGIDHTILRPSGIYGPRNIDDVSYWFITTFGSSLLGRFVIGDGRNLLQFVHVEDVVQGFRRALERPEVAQGKTYFITDSQAYTYDQIFAILAEIYGRRPPRRHLPVRVAKALVAPVEALDDLLGRQNFIWRRSTMNTFQVDRNYSISRAERELGYSPMWSLPVGLAASIQWYREHGFV